MSKRNISATGKDGNMKRVKHWSLGLIETMKDPNEIYKETENIVVIRDKYPKAKIHFLMLPKENISSIYHLKKDHVFLLEEFEKLLESILAEHKDVKLRAGFHAVPSMERLHMHIISTDMVSPFLKKKVHWNSFTTKFFMPFEVVMKELKLNGSIAKISSDLHKQLLATPLKCNQCNYTPKNMPQLKEHLEIHLQ